MRATGWRGFYGLGVLIVAISTGAQTGDGVSRPPISFRSEAQITAQAKVLMDQARSDGTGVSFVKLENEQTYGTMLVARSKTGPAEMHARWADVMFVVDGEATEVTGGTMVEGKLDVATGETRGTRVDGGTRTRISKGDVIQIPANTPHWAILGAGKTLTAYVVKVPATGGAASK